MSEHPFVPVIGKSYALRPGRLSLCYGFLGPVPRVPVLCTFVMERLIIAAMECNLGAPGAPGPGQWRSGCEFLQGRLEGRWVCFS